MSFMPRSNSGFWPAGTCSAVTAAMVWMGPRVANGGRKPWHYPHDVMWIWQVCRRQKLWDPGSFHQDFSGRPWRPGSVDLHGWGPYRKPTMGWCFMKLWERSQSGNFRKVEVPAHGMSAGESSRQCAQKVIIWLLSSKVRLPKALGAPPTKHNVLYMRYLKLWDFMLTSGLLSCFGLITTFTTLLLFRTGMLALFLSHYHTLCDTVFEFTRAHR